MIISVWNVLLKKKEKLFNVRQTHKNRNRFFYSFRKLKQLARKRTCKSIKIRHSLASLHNRVRVREHTHTRAHWCAYLKEPVYKSNSIQFMSYKHMLVLITTPRQEANQQQCVLFTESKHTRSNKTNSIWSKNQVCSCFFGERTNLMLHFKAMKRSANENDCPVWKSRRLTRVSCLASRMGCVNFILFFFLFFCCCRKIESHSLILKKKNINLR